jgi:hypothetical protein
VEKRKTKRKNTQNFLLLERSMTSATALHAPVGSDALRVLEISWSDERSKLLQDVHKATQEAKSLKLQVENSDLRSRQEILKHELQSTKIIMEAKIEIEKKETESARQREEHAKKEVEDVKKRAIDDVNRINMEMEMKLDNMKKEKELKDARMIIKDLQKSMSLKNKEDREKKRAEIMEGNLKELLKKRKPELQDLAVEHGVNPRQIKYRLIDDLKEALGDTRVNQSDEGEETVEEID